jgi:outer membrane protein TolC
MLTKGSFYAVFLSAWALLFFPGPALARHRLHTSHLVFAPPSASLRLDLRATVAYALTHAPALLTKQADIIGLLATLNKQRATQYPSILAQLENQMQESQNAAGNLAQFGITPESRFSLNTAQIVSQWTLYNGSLNQILSQEDRRRVESASAELQRSEEQMVGDTTSAFYDLVARREATDLTTYDEYYQRRLLEVARTAERAGRGAGVDVLRARVQVLRAHAAFITARTEEHNAQEALALRIGSPPDTTFLLPSRIPQPSQPRQPLSELTAKAQAQRPDGAVARADLAYAQLAESAIDTDLKPSITLSSSFGSQVSPTSFVYQQQQVDAQNAAMNAQYQLERQLAPTANIPPPAPLSAVNRHVNGFWQLGMQTNFSVPVLDYGQRANAHHAARAQITAASAALTNTHYAIEVDVRQAARNLAADAENLGLAQRADTLATQSAHIAQLQFKHGLISFTDVSQTEETTVAAHGDLVKARAAYATAFVRLRVALGYPGINAVSE